MTFFLFLLCQFSVEIHVSSTMIKYDVKFNPIFFLQVNFLGPLKTIFLF